MLKYLFFQENIDLVILKPIQKSSYNHPLQKTSSKNNPLPPPSSLLHIASILCVSIFLSFPFLPVPYHFPFPSSCFHVPSPFSFFSSLSSPILFALPCSFFPFSLFLFLRLTGKAKSCKTLMFFKKSSKNHRTIFENHPQPTFSGPNPLHSGQEGKKLQNPRVFFKNHRKIFPNPHFLDQPPFTVVRKAKSCKTLLFFSKNHRKIIEKSSKNLRKIIEKSSKNHPQPTFSGPTPLHSGQESKKLQNPPVFFKKSSKNHRKIFEKSSKNLRKFIPNPNFLDQPPFTVANRSLRDRSNGSLRDHGHLGIHAHLRITFTDHLGITFIDDGGGEGGVGMISTPAQLLQTSLLLYRITKYLGRGWGGGGMISTPAQQLQTSLLLYRITK